MATFRSGMLGVCIVTLALLGSIAAGYLLNVEKEVFAGTEYDYVTDISGLFQYDDTPQYIDYNPAKNYTGYTAANANATTPTGISYTKTTGAANAYRIITSAGSTSTIYGWIDNNKTITQTAPHEASVAVGSIYEASPSRTITRTIDSFKSCTVYDWCINEFGAGFASNYARIDIAISTPGDGEHYTVKGARLGFSNVSVDIAANYTAFGWPISINTENLTLTNDNGANYYSLYDVQIYYGNASQTNTIFDWSSFTSTTEVYSTELTATYTATVETAPTYAYMSPTDGITLSGAPGAYDTTTWNNGEDVAVADVLISMPRNTAINPYDTYALTVNVGGDRIEFNKSGNTQMRLEYGGHVATLGNWSSVMLHIDGLAGTFSVYGVGEFGTFINGTVWADIPLYSGTLTNSQYVGGVQFSTDAKPMYWTVYSTTVFMNTYNTQMISPSIELGDWFPEMETYRYAVQSTALYGDSVEINGTTYPIDADGRITLDGKKYQFNNYYLEYGADNHVKITFNNVKKTVDLGEIVDTSVNWTGAWYFTTGLYEGHEVVKNSYNWAPSWSATADTVLLVMLGLMVLAVLAVAALHINISLTDKLVLGLAAVVCIIMLGGFN